MGMGKADTAAGFVAQPSPDIGTDKVSAQPAQLAASYNISTIDSHSLFYTPPLPPLSHISVLQYCVLL